MTGPDEDFSSTRPISVAELLAKNGTIGAPPVGGRRRRRRGNSDSVTVAELTGEIPIVTDDTHDAADPATGELDEVRDDRDDRVHRDEYPEPLPRNGAAEHVDEDIHEDIHDDELSADGLSADGLTQEEADYAAHIEERDAEPMFFQPPRRPSYGGLGPKRYPGGVGAEDMSPDPLDIDDDDAAEAVAADVSGPATAAATNTSEDADELPSYLRSSGGPLFGGEPADDDSPRRGGARLDDLEFGARDEHEDEDEAYVDHESTMSSFARGALVVGQCMVAVLFGGGLFIAFDQLWKWNNIVALVLSVLVILGLVVGVRVVRKTEDIGSTLIAVAVGALVTLGPLALLQSG